MSKRNQLAKRNLTKAFPNYNKKEINNIIKKMWFHFGRIVGEYPHLNKLEIGVDNTNPNPEA